MDRRVLNNVSGRLSLRSPQRESLEALANALESAPDMLNPKRDVEAILQSLKSQFSTLADFEREFPSLCFALATGVGKTRLMGAFISYLHLAKGIRNFFVLAPNLTIYNKLIQDFTPNSAKYVFKGIAEFATNSPAIITGDDYEQKGRYSGDLFSPVTINIFNISKINSEVRGGKSPRIKRLSEYLGDSYFNYLAQLPDLVLLMDESHRYRASAGIRALNELNPLFGLELTATPFVESSRGAVPFSNVVVDYPLARAMDDGFVKEPAVVTQRNFDAKNYTKEEVETIKLMDGIRLHESTKVELLTYAHENDVRVVKPFMLVIARDTTHAASLFKLMESDEFFAGRYRGKIIQVDSSQSGAAEEEMITRLLAVESVDEPTEVVIHVNMLKEGWDVTNLYTIVPLRAANSRTLVEQSIGRGLRLPYGKRVGVPAVDRLTIVSHDKFQEIVDHANDPDSIVRAGVVIGRDIPEAGRKAVEVISAFEQAISGGAVPTSAAGQPATDQRTLFDRPEEQAVAKATYQVIKQYERLKGSDQLQDAEVQRAIVQKVQEIVRPAQGMLEGIVEAVNVAEVVQKTTELYRELSIDVPKIVVLPKGEVSCRYEDFDLDVRNINLQPVAQDILIQHLHENQRYRLQDGSGIIQEKRPEDYLVRGLIDFDDISYDEHAKLLYKLSGQVVARLRTYLTDEDDVINVLQYHQQTLVNLIHSQMQQHFVESASDYEAHVTRGFHTLRANNYSAAADENVRDFRAVVPEGQRNRIGTMVFGGFRRCLYPIQKFDSDPERRFAVLLENDDEVLKWFKPAKGDFQIHYSHEDSYEPDFVVETKTEKLLCEPKRASEMTDETVLAKADAAATWCKHATDHANENGGKPWRYLLIPHDQVQDQMTVNGLAARYRVEPKV